MMSEQKAREISDNANPDTVIFASFDTHHEANADRVIQTLRDFIEANQSALNYKVKSITRYDYIQTENICKAELYKTRLKAGVALNDMLSEWRTKAGCTEGE